MSKVGEFVLRHLSRDPRSEDYRIEHYEQKHQDVNVYIKSLEDTFPNFRNAISGKSILDIGCSEGLESIALSLLGSRQVVGIDIRIDVDGAKKLKRDLAPEKDTEFYVMDAHHTSFADNKFDAIVTLASFEHFLDPYGLLKEARRILKDDGRIYLTSSVWSHPWGAHMHFFTKVPWVQFLFSEETIMNVRRLYRGDGAKKLWEVEGGLNKVGIREFMQYIDKLNLNIEYLFLRPIKGLTVLTKLPMLNEFFTNQITAILKK